jgi:radial spoke head protein 3
VWSVGYTTRGYLSSPLPVSSPLAMQEKFTYSSEPHAVPIKRKQKYRTDEQPPPLPGAAGPGFDTLNIMNDPRVVRGNTYAAKVMTSSVKLEQQNFQKEKARKFKQDAVMKKSYEHTRLSTPPPVEGRVHSSIQTENYLEELTDKPTETDAETQTQPFMDRPVSPLFVRSKTGVDVTTQIEIGDLFDFDLEVDPILEVLCGKTIQNSMLELMQEEELEAIRREQEEFENIRNIELTEVKRLEAEARRKLAEKNRRMEQEKARLKHRLELEEKIAARAFSSQYLSNIHTGVMEELCAEGYFYDPIRKEIEEQLMVELVNGLKERNDAYSAAQGLLEDLLMEAGLRAKEMQKKSEELRKLKKENERKEMERLAAQRKEEEEAAKRAAEEEAAKGEAKEEAEEE